MCGIVGLIGEKFKPDHRDVFHQLLYMDALRGRHGTGVVEVHKSGATGVMKRAIPSVDFLDLRTYDKFRHYTIGDLRLLLGHNRHATAGGISNQTTHPFQHGPITMVHNGTLRTQYQLPKSTQFRVDSENIAYALSDIGVAETVKNLNGSFSLVWYNSDDHTVNFVRNSERPMFIAKIRDENQWAFASEKYMLLAALERNNFEWEDVFQTDELVHYTFELEDDSFELTTKKLEEHKYVSTYRSRDSNRRNQNHVESQTTSALLDKIGLRMGRRIKFYTEDFIPYSLSRNPDLGILTGWMADDPWDRVLVFSADRPKLPMGTEVSATVCGYRDVLNTKEEERGVVCNPKTLVEDNVRSFPGAKQELLPKPQSDSGKSNVNEEIAETIIHLSSAKSESKFKYHEDQCYRGPNGILLTGEQFDDLVKGGCSNCTGNIHPHQCDSVIWIDSRTPLCPDCAEERTANDGPTVH
ncbi:MAG: hypothetical protein GWO28_01225 [candidate division Zixibacteria bacterium]|nr:hypothetical protein [candidate division Zixibacteria bacterium]